MPIDSIVSACSTATYNTAKFMTKIIQKYCGKTSSIVNDSRDFIQKMKHLPINQKEEILLKILIFFLNTLAEKGISPSGGLRNLSLISCQCCLHHPVALQKFNSKISTWINLTMSARSQHKNSSSILNSWSPTASSALIRNFINNYRVQPWVHLSPLSLQISTWNTLNP